MMNQEEKDSYFKLKNENESLKAQVKSLCVAHYDLIEIEQETGEENEKLKEGEDCEIR